MDITTYILAKRYVDKVLQNSGSLQGKSAYEIAVDNGFIGSEVEWLESLIGQTPTIGDNGNWFIGDKDTGISAKPDALAPVAFSGSWNDLKDRTHYEEVYSYSFNGNLDEYDVIYTGENGLGRGIFLTKMAYVKVSPDPLTREQLLGAKVVYKDLNEYQTMYISEEYIDNEFENILVVNRNPSTRAFLVQKMLVVSVLEDGGAIITNGEATTFSKGLYIVTTEDLSLSEATISKENIFQLDEKYIPDTIARTTNFHEVAKTGSYKDLIDNPIPLIDIDPHQMRMII